MWTYALLFQLCLLGVQRATSAAVKEECSTPYHPVGPDKWCMLIDDKMKGSWDDISTYCMSFQGRLAHFEDANSLYEVVKYINEKGLNTSNFWIGAQDILEEDDWKWVYNYTRRVHMHTPLWGTYQTVQDPTGGKKENCAMLNKKKFFYMDDDRCTNNNGVMCIPFVTKKDDEEKALQKLKDERQLQDGCPLPFKLVAGHCYLVEAISTNTWSEGHEMCKALGSSMAKIDDANVLGGLYDFLVNESVTVDLWLAGSDANKEGDWKWDDGSSIKMGTPFWGITDDNEQLEPNGGHDENCLSLKHSDHFFFNDYGCNQKIGAVCEYHKSSAR